jgi:hypothetical protein
MKDTTNAFDVEIQKINRTEYIHYLSLKSIGADLITLIDKYIVSICESDHDTEIGTVKKELKSFFSGKDIRTQQGAIAEFIVHLYLKESGFNQECLFLNLEEGSIKKGFDGYYTFSSFEWIMESKSGSINTKDISHKKKLKEAYNDLKDKIGGNTSNNPWKNAYNHAKIVGSSQNILNNIKSLSKMYIDKQYPNMNDLNIIPASTIFFEKTSKSIDFNCSEIQTTISDMQFKSINAICIDNKLMDKLLEILTQ